jgi:hypothetical protein
MEKGIGFGSLKGKPSEELPGLIRAHVAGHPPLEGSPPTPDA